MSSGFLLSHKKPLSPFIIFLTQGVFGDFGFGKGEEARYSRGTFKFYLLI